MNPGSPSMGGESLWPRLSGLPLVVEVCEYDRLHAVLAYEFERVTTQVRPVGAGADGLGEDVSVFREHGTAPHETRPSLPLEREWCFPATAISSDRRRHEARRFGFLHAEGQ